MAALKELGYLLKGSGWTEADIVSSGTADSFLSASNVAKTRQAHLVSDVMKTQLKYLNFWRIKSYLLKPMQR